MTVFYRGPLATITHDRISVPNIERRSLALDEVGAVQAVEVGSADTVARHRTLAVFALVTALFVVPVVGPASATLAAAIVLMLLICAGVCVRIRPDVRYQVKALVAHEWVILVETTDRGEFRQIGRGLVRAMESRDDRPRHPAPRQSSDRHTETNLGSRVRSPRHS